ncbi:protein of unknown function [Shinella sp. WSC3-e]|nr:hypothetical protein SHINE37_42002 [Rhizobiaceae bacterium]CAK7256603.1 protein of unknown function [Shinella sp. WSC3-e]
MADMIQKEVWRPHYELKGDVTR